MPRCAISGKRMALSCLLLPANAGSLTDNAADPPGTAVLRTLLAGAAYRADHRSLPFLGGRHSAPGREPASLPPSLCRHSFDGSVEGVADPLDPRSRLQ